MEAFRCWGLLWPAPALHLVLTVYDHFRIVALCLAGDVDYEYRNASTFLSEDITCVDMCWNSWSLPKTIPHNLQNDSREPVKPRPGRQLYQVESVE